MEAVKLYGKDYYKITDHVGTQDIDSIRRRCAKELLRYRKKPNLPDAKLILAKLSVKLKPGRKSLQQGHWDEDEEDERVDAREESADAKIADREAGRP